MTAGDGAAPSPPLVFVYLGQDLPTYGRASLSFAASKYAGEVLLLSDTMESQAGPDFQTINITHWYKPQSFENFQEKSRLDRSFRQGFWLHAVERFFVLEQFMAHIGIASLFHAEADVLVFDLRGVSSACDSHGRGIFSVMDAPNRSLASLFYVNSLPIFRHFLDYLCKEPANWNEMKLLGEYTRRNPTKAHALPSEVALDSSSYPVAPSSLSTELGLFDAAAMGQWLFGIDPRNTSRSVTNHFRNPNLTFPIERARFGMSRSGTILVRYQGVEHIVRTLHIHSKITENLVRPSCMRFWLAVSALPFNIVVKRRKGVVQGLLLRQMLKGKGIGFTRTAGYRFPRLARFILGYLRSTAAEPLGSRQLVEFNRIVPGPRRGK